MAAHDWIPGTDEGLLAFSGPFSTKISADPEDYGIDASIASAYALKRAGYASALAAAVDPATRGKQTVLVKRLKRRELVDATRDVVAQIQGTMSVTVEQKGYLGIPLHDTIPTSINQPTDKPTLKVLSVDGRYAKCKLISGDPERRGKPRGVQGASICLYSGPENPPPMDITKWVTIGETSRMNFELELPLSIAPGSLVFLLAFWKNPRLMSGPPSDPVSLYIGGGVQQLG